MTASKGIKKPYTEKVYVKKSKIKQAGMGLFIKSPVNRGEIVCTYAGNLFDSSEAKYRDPTYMVNFEQGRGYKLDGDGKDGDLGHFANTGTITNEGEVYPEINARISLKTKYQWIDTLSEISTGEIILRGRFDLIAKRDLKVDEEVIVDYGKGYWHTMNKWEKEGALEKPPSAIAREERAKRRLLGYQAISDKVILRRSPRKK
jgi:hypothetical protein